MSAAADRVKICGLADVRHEIKKQVYAESGYTRGVHRYGKT